MSGGRPGPLAGRVVAVTRPPEQAAPLVEALEARGATVLAAPAIHLTAARPEALDRALARAGAGEFEWVVFTSRAGVEAVLSRAAERGVTTRPFPARVAAIGEATARALRARGVRPDLVPETFTSRALAAAFPRGSGEVLLARADIAPEGLEDVLARKGWSPVRVDAYRTRLARSLPAAVRRGLLAGTIDAVTFTSASTVRGFLKVARPTLNHPSADRSRRPAFVCIGPVTAREARASGLRVAAVADPHTIGGLVGALERVLGRARPRRTAGDAAARRP